MKKVHLIVLILFFAIQCGKSLPEQLLGVWENTMICPAQGECKNPGVSKGARLTILKDGFAKYADPSLKGKEMHIHYVLQEEETKSKSPELAFVFTEYGFEIRYIVKRISEKELELFNLDPKKETLETYVKIGTLTE
ncbi:hypothetical protein CH373_01850 [Leptospira perolatii]|uniref:Lipoprotein n=1 Tax=Leptospira perolatii TaxID=2023191 RepID=A0A2M9ZS01_9LEPT|nr:hypothetical protein [Leptospira perolatii]PJZ71271.1 hypothetical protein CH360_01850 [Leptospira perolatii]PJZ74805.1 hypothetical protein CH373_01850 [Leptospira perolatii]